MSIRQRVAGAAIAGISGTARLLGPRFYRRYLDDVGRRLGDARRPVPVDIGGRPIVFAAPNEAARQAAESLYRAEPALTEWLDGLGEGDVLWDVGAGIGLHAVYAAARGARVVGFEAAPANLAALARNVRVNRFGDQIMVVPLALAPASGQGAVLLDSDEPGEAEARLGDGPADPRRAISAPVFSADDFVARFAPPLPTRLKLNAAQAAAMLRGAAALLAAPGLRSVALRTDRKAGDADPGVTAALRAAGFAHRGVFRSRHPGQRGELTVLFDRG